jgi:hypothetical protein
MKIKFLLKTKNKVIGELYYDWQYPFIHRIGEGFALKIFLIKVNLLFVITII